METLKYNPILIFKQQGEEANDKNDFLLVIQTEFQRDMFKKYGNRGLCIDAMYRVNDYDFHLITILVLDDFQEGIPVAWALANHEDKIAIVHILQALREQSGLIMTRWFMSDMAEQYYNAWKEVFPTTDTKYLWCAWHIDRAWRNGLKKHVNKTEKQKEVYHYLRVLMMETDIGKFRALLAKCLTFIQTLHPAFGEYFINIYCSHINQWAMCYRIGTPMNTNMYAESFHRVIKIVYLQQKHNRRMDSLIYTLLKISRDKAFEQLMKFEKGKHTHRICDINKRHRTAVSFAHLATITCTAEDSLKVSSESRNGTYYTVTKV